MQITQSDLHALAHTARILIALAEKPDHPRKAEYARQLTIYKGEWAALSDFEQQGVAHALIESDETPDMTSDTVAAAIAALEN